MKNKTTEGYKVSGLAIAFNVKDFAFNQYAGRVRIVADNPFYDDYARWDKQGRAIEHEYGDITITEENKR